MRFFTLVLFVIFVLNLAAQAGAVATQNPQPSYKIEFFGTDEVIAKLDGKIIARGKLAKVDRIVTEYNVIDVPDSFTQEQKQLANTLNLEAKWVSGKRFIYLPSTTGKGNLGLPISLLDHVELLRHQAGLKAKFPVQPLTDAQRKRYEELEASIELEVDKHTAEIAKLKANEGYKLKKVETSTFVSEVVASSIQKSGSIFTFILDGTPYIVDANSLITYGREVCPTCNPNNHNMTFKVQTAGSLTCQGMTTAAQDTPIVRIKLNQYYAVANPQLPIQYFAGERMVFADTVQGTALCTQGGSVDRIFASSFEDGAQ